MKIITSGVGSDYVLAELCNHLRFSGHDVTELDFGQLLGGADDLINPFIDKNAIYITSSHTNLTLDVTKILFPQFNAQYPNYLSPLEIINKINPKASIYIPHDLLNPFGDACLNEYRFLDLYDYILTPYSPHALQATLGIQTQVIKAGWIKQLQITQSDHSYKKSNPPRITLFISLFEHLRWRHGDQGLIDYFAPLLKENVRVKLPVWHDVETIESIFNARFPGSVIPATESSIKVMQDTDIVICNGASSIHAESVLMGLPTICLLDDEAVLIDEQISKLKYLNSIIFHDYRKRTPINEEFIRNIALSNRSRSSSHFDYSIVDDIIKKYS